MIRVLLGLFVVVGLVVGGYTIMGIVRNHEMVQIVKSDEVKEIVEKVEKMVFKKDLSVYEKIFSLFSTTSMKRKSGGDLMIDYLNQP